MSTLKATNIQNASSSTTNIALDTSGNVTVGNNVTVGGGITASAGTVVMSSPYTMRNKIINGAMVIDQRNAGASVTPTSGAYTLDRWAVEMTQASKFTIQQNAGAITPPAGFNYYLGATSSSAYTVTSTDYFVIGQAVEGFNCADLSFGTASAQTVTLSFWVRSSLTGTFGGTLLNSGASRNYVFSYSISAANTWEQKTVTISGDTSGTWLTNSSAGLYIRFCIGAGASVVGTAGSWSATVNRSVTGQTSVVGTNGATFYITGVQLERGTAATPFEYRNYQQELAMCQRYFFQFGGDSSNDQVGAGQAFSATAAGATIRFPVTMRANPTLDSFTASNWSVMNGSGGLVAATAIVLAGGQTNRNGTQLSITVASGLTAGQGSSLLANTSSARLPFNSEL